MSRTRNKVKIDDYGWEFNRNGRFCGFHKSVVKWYRKFKRRELRASQRLVLMEDPDFMNFRRERKNVWYEYW
jgi:hypothetical protein